MDWGLYIHYPFCRRICPFCDFVTVAGGHQDEKLQERYCRALATELGLRHEWFGRHFGQPLGTLRTLYFGGGTPSLAQPSRFAKILESVRQLGPCSASLEVTLEVDPGTVNSAKLQAFQEAGINRLSLGVQSFQDETLATLGRGYQGDEAHRLLDCVHSVGNFRVSVDLMYGIPEQTLQAWRADLATITDYGDTVGHLSLYLLTLSERSPFYSLMRRRSQRELDEVAQVGQYECASKTLSAAGFEHYEISSWARPGEQGRHNRGYWDYRSYGGVGVGAHGCASRLKLGQAPPHGSLPAVIRWTNERSLQRYCERIEAGELPVADVEVLEPEQIALEMIMLGLRRREGLNRSELQALVGWAPPHYATRVSELVEQGILTDDGNQIALAASSNLISNEIFSTFA